MKHKIELLKRIETEGHGKRIWTHAFDIWEIEINGIAMTVSLTGRGNSVSEFHGYSDEGQTNVLRFSNRLVTNHPDYKNIRKIVLEKIRATYTGL